MSWKDKLAGSQGGGTTYPQFLKLITQRFEMKADEKGETGFVYYDKEKAERCIVKKPLEGVLLGSAMVLGGYSNDIGKNGGTITSSVFFSYKDKGVAFCQGQTVIKGVMSDIKQYILDETKGCKVGRVYFILNNHGIFQVTTNISFSIFEMNNLDPKVFTENFAKLYPSVYNPESPEYDNKFKKILGPFAMKNKPRFASITQGEPITDKIADDLELENIIDLYEEWKEFTYAGGASEDAEDDVSEEAMEAASNANAASLENEKGKKEEEKNDLPF